MRASTLVLALASLLPAVVPARAQQVERAAKTVRSGVQIETGEACSGLSREECCSQMLELAGFRAQGDYLPSLIKTTVQLACQDERRVVTAQVCKSIAMSRGFSVAEAMAICKPAARECKKNGTCRQCTADLAKLRYEGSYHACRALTYVPDRSRTRVVVLRSGGNADSDTRFEITKRRTRLR
jgi:hypothetical protein